MTTSVTIAFDIEGESVPIAEASWYEVAPCGCTCAVTVAESFYGSRVVLTAEDAWPQFYECAEAMKRAQAEGFRVEVGRRTDVSERLHGHCPHDPEWGVPLPPQPDGYVWAGIEDSKRSHLVMGVRDREARWLICENPYRFDAETRVSLCGKSSRFWSTHWASNAEAPTCRRCERVALTQVQS